MGRYFIYDQQYTNVGAALIPASVRNTPSRGIIQRIQATVSAGTAINGIRVVIANATAAAPTFTQTVIDTGMLLQPFDSAIVDPSTGTYQIQIPIYYELVAASVYNAGGAAGNLNVLVAVDDATADHTIDVRLTIQDVSADSPGVF